MRACFIGIMVFLVPPAAATGVLNAGPIVIALDNGQASNCIDDASGLCLASARGGSLGDLEVDTRQRIRYIGVAPDESFRRQGNDALLYPLLPGGDLYSVDASTFVIPNPMFRFLAENVGEWNAPEPLSAFGVFFNNRSYGFECYCPGNDENGFGFAERSDETEFYENGTDYESIQPSNQDRESEQSSDLQLYSALTFLCYPVGDECYVQQGSIAEQANDTTPNVRVGLNIVDAELAASSDALDGLEPEADSVMAAEGPARLGRAPLEFAGLARSRDRTAEPPPSTYAVHLEVDPIPPRIRPPTVGPHPVVAADDVALVPDGPGMPPVIVLAASFVVAIAASLLHSRILGHEGRLEAGVRAELLARLAQTGPRAVTDVARDLGYDRKTILYHARLLVKAERVRLERCGQNLMIALPKQDLPARRVSATASCARVLETLRAAAAPLDRTAIHAALPEMPRRTRDHALAVLVGEGIVEVAPEGFRLRARAA